MTAHRSPVARLALVLLTPIALVAQQSRDAARPLTGAASLSGIVVTDEAGDRPVRRATVTLSIPGDARSPRIVATDDEGRFAFGDLPGGNFTLSASKPGYVTTYHGARRPGSTVGVPITLTDGQSVTSVKLQLLRGAAITGIVRDDRGRPAPLVTLRLHRVATSRTGQRTLTPGLTGLNSAATTDDRGVYRFYGVPPGDYAVEASPVMPGPFGLGESQAEVRQTTSAELQWAEQQIRGAPVGTPATAAAAPAPGASVALASVFHPDGFDPSAAAIVSVAAGQERAGVDVRLQYVPTARVVGRVADANGQPVAGMTLMLMPTAGTSADVRAVTLYEVGLISGTSGRSGTDGRFVIQGVQPGQYLLVGRATSGRGAPAAPVAGLWASTEVSVSGRDVQGVALTVLPGMSVTGRVVFEGAPAPADARVTVRLSSAGAGGFPAAALAQTGGTGEMSFAIPGVVPGAYRAGVTWGSGAGAAAWVVKSAVLNGRDVADAPFDVRPQEAVNGLVVTLVSPAELSGTLYDGAGRPTSDLSMILFAADRAHWYQGSRRLRQPVRPASSGRFSVSGLAPGEYYLAALTDFDPNDWYDPEFLEQVVPGAIKVTLTAGERKTQDLKLAGGK